MGGWTGTVAHLRASSAERRRPQPPSPWKSPVETGKEPHSEVSMFFLMILEIVRRHRTYILVGNW